MVVTRREGVDVWDDEGNGYLDFSSQLVFTNIGHQHPRVVAAIQEQAARLCTIAPRHGQRRPLRGGPADRGDSRPTAWTRCSSPTAAPTRSSTPSGWPGCTPDGIKVLSTYRSYHGGTGLAINVTGDPRRWANDNGSAGIVHFFGPFLYRSRLPRHHRGGGVRARARPPRAGDRVRGPPDDRRDRPRDHPRHRRHHAATARLPRRRPGAVRPARHRLHRRRGDGRLRPDRRVVRRRALRRRARPDHLRQGRRTPATSRWAAWSSATTIARHLRRAGLPRRAHLLRPPARLRRGGGHHRRRCATRASSRTPTGSAREVLGPGLREARGPAPQRRRGARARVSSGRSTWSATAQTREPLAPYGGTSPAMNAMVAACKAARAAAVRQLQPASTSSRRAPSPTTRPDAGSRSSTPPWTWPTRADRPARRRRPHPVPARP